jgi:predicted alpha/beta superfamily hydrolase/uncharacterized protein involved in tolerance to divalent cations
MNSEYLVVLVTIADADRGVALGRTLVEERLAACVQVIPGGAGIYRWEGEIHIDEQAQLVIKTTRAAWPALESRIQALHDDQVPEILALPVVDGLHSYLDWMAALTLDPNEEDTPAPAVATWLDYTDVYPRGHHRVMGHIKLLRGVYSPQLHNQRDIAVYLPPSYETGARRYPVLYMHDGQNLFDSATSYAGEWYVDETLEGLASQGIEAIVVGVPNAGERRGNEYTPFPHPQVADATGEAYIAFLAGTLKPLIDRAFRTLPRRESTAIMGSSLGGLISLYGYFQRPDVFGLAGIFSPAFHSTKNGVFPFVKKAPFSPGRLYMDVGTAEGMGLVADPRAHQAFATRYVQLVRTMNAALERKGYRPGADLLYIEETGGIHHESAWARRLPAALRFLLGK